MKACSNTIEMLDEQQVKSTRMQVDMGCNFYVQAEVEDTSTLIVDIGMGVFVELSRKQAHSFSVQKLSLYEKSIKALKDKMSQVKSHRRFFLEAIREIMNLDALPQKEQDLRFL